jgi:periplasmic copper chaperone A
MRARTLLVALAALLVLPASAQAHVQLTPDAVAPGSDALFTIRSPNESQQPLTGLRLTIPASLVVEGAAATPGFTSQVVRDQAGRAVTLSWQGGDIPAGGLALFQFSATVPQSSGQIRLTATQTFADGSTKLWHSAVIDVTAPGSGDDGTARLLAALALAMGVAALGVALVSTRRRQR